ncbi:MAG TPA: FIST N-terminal domain-containing protein [Polyangiaceae bacterium]|nr:FIST N-terminal domain-containing protein [Polyangiaceae bacterium]
MQVETLRFDPRQGWSAPFPDIDSERTLVMVFAAPEYFERTAPIDELRGAYQRATVIGCSTAGEIVAASIHDRSLAAAVVRFDATDVAHASAPVAGAGESRTAGASLARQLARRSLRAVLVLSDGISVNGSELLRGINDEIGDVPVSGGLAADGDRFRRTWVMAAEAPSVGRVAAVGLYGERIRVSHGSRGGWDIFGPERVITRSTGNVLYELDNRPALALYKQYLGERAAGLPATALLFPLAVRASQRDEPVVRTILGVNDDENSLTFAGDVPQGALAQLMRANFDRLIDGAGSAAKLASLRETPSGDSLAIAISCVGRRLVLGERAEEEVEAAAQVLGDCKLIGFYSYGEISPYASGRCELHNQTMTLTRVWEA